MDKGERLRAIRAAAVEMNPSIRTGIRREAAPRMRPAMPPISNPPTLARTSNPSFGSGRLRAMLLWITETLRRRCSSSSPVPLPAISPGGLPVSTAAMAALGVVLAMPMSPVPKRSVPGERLSAISIPASTLNTASSRLMAGPSAMLPVPARMRLEISQSLSFGRSSSEATPRSATTTRAPVERAMALMPAPPRTKLWTICAVTSRGYLLTPSAATPWSAAMTTTVLFLKGGLSFPVIAAISRARSIRRPSAQWGMVSRSRRSFARAAAPASKGPIRSRVLARRFIACLLF